MGSSAQPHYGTDTDNEFYFTLTAV